MEETAISGGGGGIPWLWGVASAAQMGLGIRSYIKGHAGSAASASIFILQTNGIHGAQSVGRVCGNPTYCPGIHQIVALQVTCSVVTSTLHFHGVESNHEGL
ncbi:hypothetical protein TSUD_174870 [Trifolium subterraneum]|uniref:Uncharacterized protein n=1 Tax=Trifolium subterraneum TaxID=3900 RepID=A0A2Z6PN83_TRISU|nr:hypothetical protein TSUD_174870 [Trifolium subterraneum]